MLNSIWCRGAYRVTEYQLYQYSTIQNRIIYLSWWRQMVTTLEVISWNIGDVPRFNTEALALAC